MEEEEFDDLLQETAKLRGHMCLGMPLGVKMAKLGLQLLGMEDAAKREDLVVFVENSKCAVDGIQVTTGCTAGSGRLKMLDYGKSAATFVDGGTGVGFRITTKKDFQKKAFRLGVKDGIVKPDDEVVPLSKLDRKIVENAFLKMSIEELLEYRAVKVKWNKPLMPDRTAPTAICDVCGEEIMGGKGVVRGEKTLCGACAEGPYYSPRA